ncbi:MAG: desulfoferrodoxin [Lachnospiraceae bacterium]|nr:desulfoferrodoxin [Lachnospiraceae bacterium]
MKFYQCEKCKKIVGMIQKSACPTMCCGEPMKEMVPNSTDAAAEKHVPVIGTEGNLVTVTVGSAAHPMLEEHYIMWIALESRQGMQRKALVPGGEPKAVFALAPGDEPVAAYAYCNLHGLWEAKI